MWLTARAPFLWSSWLARLHGSGVSNTKGVALGDGTALDYSTWSQRLRTHFERLYYIPADPEHDSQFVVDQRYVNLRGMLKDTLGSAHGWSDYQLRPNQAVALALAPELVSPRHAQAALAQVGRLMGPGQLGMKTLDRDDMAYRGDYDNNSQADASVAKGFNYHQGPEWVWPLGYYLRARINFPPLSVVERPGDKPTSAGARTTVAGAGAGAGAGTDDSAAILAGASPSAGRLYQWLMAVVQPHRAHLSASASGGLPELTNHDGPWLWVACAFLCCSPHPSLVVLRPGTFCEHSCVVQAWSSATLVDAVFDLISVVGGSSEAVGAAHV